MHVKTQYTLTHTSARTTCLRTGFPHNFNGSSILKALVCILLLFSLAACGTDDMSDLRGYVSEVKARKKGKIPPLPIAETYETYAYNEVDLRNPFVATKSERTARGPGGSGITPDLKREREVLEQFPLDTLKMVGILEQTGERWALVKAQDGTLYRTRKGNYIGQDNGRITKINETSLELTEIVPDGLGGWVKRQSTLSATE